MRDCGAGWVARNSGARPGAPRESLEQHLKRERALAEIANSNTGVKQSYDLLPGR